MHSIHSVVLQLTLVSYVYSVPCKDSNCSLISKIGADLRHLLLSGRAGGWNKKKKKEKCDCVAIMCDRLKGNVGCSATFYCFCPLRVIPPSPPVTVCSLPLLCSLSEDWGESVPPCDEGLLRDASAVCGPGEPSCTEVTGRWRGSVELCSRQHSVFLKYIQVFSLWIVQRLSVVFDYLNRSETE